MTGYRPYAALGPYYTIAKVAMLMPHQTRANFLYYTWQQIGQIGANQTSVIHRVMKTHFSSGRSHHHVIPCI